MIRVLKVLLFALAAVIVLACNLVTRPISQAQETAATVQSLATALPVETLQSLATALPMQTLEAIPSAIPEFGNLADPQSEPLAEWNGIPIMPAATAGAESGDIYSFRAGVSVADVVAYYKTELPSLGWSELFSMPDAGGGALLTYQMGEHILTITVTSEGSGSLVFLTYD